jgi:hypothetical protein
MPRLPRDVVEQIQIFGIATLFVMALVWLSSVWWLFRRLRRYHSATYESVGSPTLFWNNSPRNNVLFMRFLFGLRWRQLPDPLLVTVCWLMLAFFCVYMILFLCLIALFFRDGAGR